MSNPIEPLEKGNHLPIQIISNNNTGNPAIQAEKDEVNGSNPSSTIISQKVLEQNEDIIAAIGENQKSSSFSNNTFSLPIFSGKSSIRQIK